MIRGAGTLLLCSMALVCSCGETVAVHSGPSGASVYLDERPVGTTPLRFSLPRGEVTEAHRLRIEKDGYQPVTTGLHSRVAGGRVTGAIFTLGILAVFRSMHVVDPVFAQLQPTTSSRVEQDRALGESLRNVRELHEMGRISDEELQRRQQELLRNR